MKKIKILAIMLAMSLACANTIYTAIPVKASEIEENSEKNSLTSKVDNRKSYTIEEIKQLNGNEGIDISYNTKGLVKSISGKYTDLIINSGDDAINSLYNVKDLFGFKDPSKEFIVNKINRNGNQTIYRLQQVYEGYLVYNNEVIISVNEAGKPTFISSHYSAIDNINLKNLLDRNGAIELAKSYCKMYDTRYEADKIIYTDGQGVSQAAWMIKCINKKYPTKDKILFINAESGKLISESPLTIN